MDRNTTEKIRRYLNDCGQSDPKFRLGDIIRYTPTEIADLLKKMPEDKPPEDKPPIGARPFEIVFSERICELATAITIYSDRCTTNADTIKLWAQEIEELCDVVWYLKNDIGG